MGDTIHGTTVALGEAGVLVRGAQGAGKTALALALIDHVRGRGGFARLVADDRTRLETASGRLVASAPETIAGCVEMRGEGIVRVRALAAVRLTHVVDLVPARDAPRMPEEPERGLTLLSVGLPRLRLPERSTATSTVTIAVLLARDGLTVGP